MEKLEFWKMEILEFWKVGTLEYSTIYSSSFFPNINLSAFLSPHLSVGYLNPYFYIKK